MDVVNKICLYLDKHNPQRESYKSLIKFVEDRQGHDFRYAIDSSLIKKNLHWVPKHNFDEGLEKQLIGI